MEDTKRNKSYLLEQHALIIMDTFKGRVSTVPWIPGIPGNILGSEKAYLENPWINFGTGIPWKKFSGHFKYLNSLEKFVVAVVVVALADGCSFPEVHRTFHESTQKL